MPSSSAARAQGHSRASRRPAAEPCPRGTARPRRRSPRSRNPTRRRVIWMRSPLIAGHSSLSAMTEVRMIDAEAVFAAVSPADAVERTRTAFERHHAGEWVMPAKTYVDAPPHGDFRAMPARGEGLAILKWVTSFPGNPARGLPVVAGALLVSSAETGELLAILRLRRSHLASNRRSSGGLRSGACARRRRDRRADRLWRQRRLGGAVPRRCRLRRRRLRRSARGKRGGPGGRARLAGGISR